MMDRRAFLYGLMLGTLSAPLAAEAQQAGKVYRVGFLGNVPSPPFQAEAWQRFVSVFREAGFVEGKNLVFERRFAEGQVERFPVLAAELAALRVEVIVTAGAAPALAVRQAAPAVPNAAIMADLVGTGLAATIPRPGGNATGFSYMTPEVSAKRLELLLDVAPNTSRVGVLWNPTSVHEPKVMKAVEVAAQQSRVSLQPVSVRQVDEYDAAFDTLRSARADAVIVFENPLNVAHRERIAALALTNRLPTMFELRSFVAAGGLMSYGPTANEMYSVVASQAVKILRGAKPGDLPVQQPTKLEFVINLKTAKALGLTIVPSLLLRADQIIE